MRYILFFIMSMFLTVTSYATHATANVPAVKVTQQSEVKVNINKADNKALMQISGFNQHKAHALLTYRKKHGEFTSLDDLRKVPGFKRMSEEKFKAMVEQFSLT